MSDAEDMVTLRKQQFWPVWAYIRDNASAHTTHDSFQKISVPSSDAFKENKAI